MRGKTKTVVFEVDSWEQQFLTDKLGGVTELTFYPHRLTYDSLHEARDSDYLISFIYSDLSSRVLDHLRHLKGIITMSVGTDHIDLELADQRRIMVSNCPTYGPNTVAQHTMALLLALSRRLVESIERTREGIYDYRGLTGWDLKDKTLGIIGTGKIGSLVAQMAFGFEMKLLGYDHHKIQTLTENFKLEYVSMEKLLSDSDVITLHVPLTDGNRHLLDRNEFLKMKRGAVILNTARGGLINPQALIEAIENGIVSQAGIDVLDDESLLKEEKQFFSQYFSLKDYQTALADHHLMHHPKVLVTPHNAFNSRESLTNILNTTVENIIHMINGDQINVVE